MSRQRITAEEFDAWLNEPVTEFVMTAALKAAEANRQAWLNASWSTGVANPQLLTELRTRADAYRALAETGFAGWASVHEEEE